MSIFSSTIFFNSSYLQVEETKVQTRAAKKIQAQQRRKASTRRVQEMKAESRAATKIQAVYRGGKVHDFFYSLKSL